MVANLFLSNSSINVFLFTKMLCLMNVRFYRKIIGLRLLTLFVTSPCCSVSLFCSARWKQKSMSFYATWPKCTAFAASCCNLDILPVNSGFLFETLSVLPRHKVSAWAVVHYQSCQLNYTLCQSHFRTNSYICHLL